MMAHLDAKIPQEIVDKMKNIISKGTKAIATLEKLYDYLEDGISKMKVGKCTILQFGAEYCHFFFSLFRMHSIMVVSGEE